MRIKFFCVFFMLAQLISAERPNFVFDLSGSLHGYGDIIGPWSVVYGLKKLKPKANYVVVLDSRARDILVDTYKSSIRDISKQFGVVFYSDKVPQVVPAADFYFQLFFGGRKIKDYENGTRDFVNPYFCHKNTVTIISDTMHGSTLDEAVGPGFTLYFKPPGIGAGRSGILNSSDLEKLVNLAPIKQKEIAASLFEQRELKDLILSRGQFQGAQLSFMYGLHNELMNKALIGQSAEFIEGLAEYHTQSPVFVLSPQKHDILKTLMPASAKILTLSELQKVDRLQNRVYILQLPNLSNFQFSALVASADLPILLEGNNAISQAIRLQKEFLVLRSPWNKAQIEDLIDVDSELGGPWIYPGIYNLSDDSKLRFKAWFKHQKKGDWIQRFYQQYALSQQIPDFVDKLNEVITISSKLRDSKLGASELKQLASSTTDEYLAYSMAALSKSAIQVKNVDTARLKPNKPNFSLKLELLAKNNFQNRMDEAARKSYFIGEGPNPCARTTIDSLIECLNDMPAENVSHGRHKVFVSLSTSPDRLSLVSAALRTIDLDLVDEILLVLPKLYKNKEPYPAQLPLELELFPKLKVLRPDDDLGPISKLIPGAEYAQAQDPDSIIITIDDDVGYPEGLWGQLIRSVISTGQVAAGHAQRSGFFNIKSNIFKDKCEPGSTCDIVEGFGAIAYPVNKLSIKGLIDSSKLSKECRLGDDIVISYQLAKAGIQRYWIQNKFAPGVISFGHAHLEDANYKQIDYWTSYQKCMEAMEASWSKSRLSRKYAVNYYIVNLKRSPERRAYMQNQFNEISGIKPVFVEAVDGKTLAKHSNLKPGEVGIYQTTKDKIIPLAAKGDISVILEDDVVLPKNFPEEISVLLKDAPPNWDIIYLGCNENVYADANGKISSVQTDNFNYNLCPSSVLEKSAGRIKKIKSDRCIAGTWGYMLNQRSAEKIRRLLGDSPMTMSIDNQFSRLTGDDKLDSYCVSPQVVHPNDALESTIR